MFTRVLVANRGEIAVRLVRALHELNAEAVAIYSEPDRTALHVRLADRAYPVGPAPTSQSYLNSAAILDVAKRSGSQAIHPGYGFLSENAAFARQCAAAGLTFVGPSPEALALMGDKVAARRLAAAAGVPTVPGTAEPGDAAAAGAAAQGIGYPLLIKAAAGGGGKGMRAVRSPEELAPALTQARREAEASFGNGSVFLERLVERPRHIEVQLFGDGTGRVEHLGERECSLQRRYQKVLEEAPAPQLDDGVRRRLWAAAVAAASAAKYAGAGTIEFLFEPVSQEFYFLEMNARLQVEHAVTEIVSGVDLVQAQLLLASGASIERALWGQQPGAGDPRRVARGQEPGTAIWAPGSGGVVDGPHAQGLHAIEARIYAEDPANNWLPSTGTLGIVREPGGPGIRIDSACEPGQEVTIHYDPLLAKLIAWGSTRDQAIARLRRAVDEYVLTGVRTTLPFYRWLVHDRAFRAADLSTAFIPERWHPEQHEPVSALTVHQLRAAALSAAEDLCAQSRTAALQRTPALSPPETSQWRALARREALR